MLVIQDMYGEDNKMDYYTFVQNQDNEIQIQELKKLIIYHNHMQIIHICTVKLQQLDMH